jgi:DNA-binding SARP family transcriptional activator
VVRLCPAGGLSVDVDVFEHAAATARSPGDIAALRDALRWTGPLLPEDEYADWAEADRDRLGDTHAAVVSLLGSRVNRKQPSPWLRRWQPRAASTNSYSGY